MTHPIVRIWSGERRAYWRPNARGYTVLQEEAGRWPQPIAENMTAHCGPEKAIALEPATNGRSMATNFLKFCARVFGPLANDRKERCIRFFEEAAELAQAVEIDKEQLIKVIERTYSRPKGGVYKELSQCALTLELFHANEPVPFPSLQYMAEEEADRCYQVPDAEWHRRHKAKSDLGIAQARPEEKCDTCGEPVDPRADACANCG